MQIFKGPIFAQKSQPGQNGELIAKLKDDICQRNASDIEIGDPPVQFPDIRLVVTVNYKSVYKVIPLVEVKSKRPSVIKCILEFKFDFFASLFE